MKSESKIPQNEAESSQALSHFEIVDKHGSSYDVQYHQTPKDEVLIPYESFSDEIRAEIRQLIHEGFPRYDDERLDSVVAGMRKGPVALVQTSENKLVAVASFKKKNFEYMGTTQSVLSQSYFATDRTLEGRGIMQAAVTQVLRTENPDVSFGHTANAGTYILNQRIAAELGYEFYPTETTTPPAVVALARKVGDEVGLTRSLDDRLVITYKEGHPSTSSKGDFSFFTDQLKLKANGESGNQSIRYMLIKPSLLEVINHEKS